jgi:hypothetical protein
MKPTHKYLLYILGLSFFASCAPERKTSLGSDSIGVIGYNKPEKQVKCKILYVSNQTARNRSEN